MSWLYAYFTVAIVLDHAHLVSPVGLAWRSRAMRRHMILRWEKFLLLPLAIVALSLAVGWFAGMPLRCLIVVYAVWNAYHFGAQHFGVASIAGWRSGPRWVRKWPLVIGTMALMFVPNVSWPMLVIHRIVDFAHWVTAIGLSAWASRQWIIFGLVALAIGGIGFLWKGVAVDPKLCGMLPACTAVRAIPLLIGLRCGLGFVHFLYDRWVWQSGSPVRHSLA